MRKQNILLVAMTLLIPFSARATCREVRFDRAGQPFSKIPIYDQQKYSAEDPGICFAVTSAQLLDADRFFKGEKELKQLSSPISIALHYHLSREKKEKRSASIEVLGLGSEVEALLASNSKDLCDQKFLERFIPLFGEKVRNPPPKSELNKNSVSSLANFLRSLLEQRKEMLNLQEDLFHEPVKCNQNDYINARSPNPEKGRACEETNFLKQIENTLTKLCGKNSFRPSVGRVERFTGVTKEENQKVADLWSKLQNPGSKDEPEESAPMTRAKKFQEKLAEIFNSENPVPVSLGLHHAALLGKREASPHAILVIGQRENEEGKCEYLLRNSYGPTCQFQGESYVYPCKDGQIWVPGEVLGKEAIEMVWIPRGPA